MDEKHGNGPGIVARLCGLYRRQKSSLKRTLQSKSKSSMRWLFATEKEQCRQFMDSQRYVAATTRRRQKSIGPPAQIKLNLAGEVTINRLIESISMREI